ncbi:MAG: sigma-70 family RNA polymerase sigma factor [Ferruginibacter sp.]
MKGNINKELTARLQDDNIEAFNSLYWKYHSAIYYNALKITRDTIVAEDIVQEVFISLWEKRYELDPELEIAGWLFVVSYNKSVTWLKRKLKESLVRTELEQPVEDVPDPGKDLVNAQVIILEKAIEQLSPQRRKVFELCKVQRRTYEEAAEELQLSKHTVKEYLSGAVVSIKEYIKQHPEYSSMFLCTVSFETFIS